MAQRSNFRFISAVVVLAVGAVFWVIALGGFGAVTGKCNDVIGSKADDCGQENALEWFAVILQLVVLVLLGTFAFLTTLAKLRSAITAYLVIATSLFIYHANTYCTYVHFKEDALKFTDALNAYRAAAAGSVLVCIYNFLVIIYISFLDDVPTAAPTVQTRQIDLEAGRPAASKAVAEIPPPAVSVNA